MLYELNAALVSRVRARSKRSLRINSDAVVLSRARTDWMYRVDQPIAPAIAPTESSGSVTCSRTYRCTASNDRPSPRSGPTLVADRREAEQINGAIEDGIEFGAGDVISLADQAQQQIPCDPGEPTFGQDFLSAGEACPETVIDVVKRDQQDYALRTVIMRQVERGVDR